MEDIARAQLVTSLSAPHLLGCAEREVGGPSGRMARTEYDRRKLLDALYGVLHHAVPVLFGVDARRAIVHSGWDRLDCKL